MSLRGFPGGSILFLKSTTNLIENTIESKLESLGYSNDENNPDLIVRWKVFDNPLVLRGYAQPKLKDWLHLNSVLLATQNSNDIHHDPNKEYNEINYNFNKGMFLISFMDVSESQLLWQGYIPGVFRGNNDRKVNGPLGRYSMSMM